MQQVGNQAGTYYSAKCFLQRTISFTELLMTASTATGVSTAQVTARFCSLVSFALCAGQDFPR